MTVAPTKNRQTRPGCAGGWEAVSERVRKRRCMMLWAYINFNSSNVPQKLRERITWRFLLEWARLGGTPDEVIR